MIHACAFAFPANHDTDRLRGADAQGNPLPFHVDHIIPKSTLHPGLGIDHVANFYIMVPALNQFFQDHPHLHHVKLNMIGDVRQLLSVSRMLS